MVVGACVVVGVCAWLQGPCMVVGGVRGCRGHAWLWVGHACVGYDEIRSMSGWYTSYWNAFLFLFTIKFHNRQFLSKIMQNSEFLSNDYFLEIITSVYANLPFDTMDFLN